MASDSEMSARLNGHVFHDDNGQNVKKKKNKILKRNDSRIPSFTQRYTQSKIAHGERRFKKKKTNKKTKTRDTTCASLDDQLATDELCVSM